MMDQISEKELKLRAKEGLTKRDALLLGQTQAEGLRNLLNISVGNDSEYPSQKELRNCKFNLPVAVQWIIGDITVETMEDKKERMVFFGFDDGKFTYSKTHLGTETGVMVRKNDLFPDDLKGVIIAEVHTHPPMLKFESLPSNSDICEFVTHDRHVPVKLVSGERPYIMVKSADYYQKETPSDNQVLYKQLKRDLDNATRRFIRRNSHHNLEKLESFLASFLNSYGIVLFTGKEDVKGLGFPSPTITNGSKKITFSAVEPMHGETLQKIA